MSPDIADEVAQALQTIQPVPITNENFARWGQVVRLPDADPNAVQVNQGTFSDLVVHNAVSWLLDKMECVVKHKQFCKAVYLNNKHPLACDP